MHQRTSSRKIHLTWWQLVSIRENLIYLKTISLAISFRLNFAVLSKAPGSIKEERKKQLHWIWSERNYEAHSKAVKIYVRKISHCWSKYDFLMPYCILMKTLNRVPDFPSQLMDEDYWSVGRHRFFLPFSSSGCFVGCFISTTYNCFMMKAAFQLISKWNVLFHMGRAQEECLTQEKKSGICQWCKPDRKGRKGPLVIHKRILRQWKRSPTGSVSNWGHLPAIR